jgi:hypothetical protein
MRRGAGFLLGLTLILIGCNKKSDDSTAFLEAKASNRPIVAIVPILDHSRSDLNWNVSQELSQSIRKRLVSRNQLYVMGEDAFVSKASKALTSHDPFDLDTAWVRKTFTPNEFVVFMELIEHNETPILATELPNEAQEAPAELALSVRVRVFDVRDKTPKLVLQEIVQQAHHIPRQFTKVNFNQVPWGDEAFDVSPLGIAHDMLCKELASRVEDYILISDR